MTIVGVLLVALGGVALSAGSGFGWVLLAIGVLLLLARQNLSSAVDATSSNSLLPPDAVSHSSSTTGSSPLADTATASRPVSNPSVAEPTELPVAHVKPPAAPTPERAAPEKAPRKEAAQPPVGLPGIVTRTTDRPGQPPLVDPFLHSDRPWSVDEERRLLREYVENRTMMAIAARMRIDQREVAKRLIVLMFDTSGDLDAGDPPRNGARWTAPEFDRALTEVKSGLALEGIARRLERTQLGVGWRLLERAPEPFPPSIQTRFRLGLTSSH